MVFKVFQDVGGAHPQTFYKAFNWDQGLRRPIVLDPAGQEKIQPLFQPGTNPWPIIFPLVETDLEKQLGTKPAISPQVGLNPATYENFAITERHVDVLLRPGRGTAGVGGCAVGDDPAAADRQDDRLTAV